MNEHGLAALQQAILGAVLLENSVIHRLRTRLRPEDFQSLKLRQVYEAMVRLAEAASPIDLRTVEAAISLNAGEPPMINMDELAGLDLLLPDIDRIESYVSALIEHSQREQLRQLAVWLGGRMMGRPPAEVLNELSERASAIAGRSPRPPRSLFAAMDEVLESVSEGHLERLRGLQTPWPGFNRLGPGLPPGALVVIAGRPGMGKSCLAWDLTLHHALNGRRVAFFSYEMSIEELGWRALSSLSIGPPPNCLRIPTRHLRSGHLSEAQWAILWATLKSVQTLRLDVEDRPLILSDLEAACLSIEDLALVVVDYLQLVTTGRRFSNRDQEVSEIARRLKLLARRLGVPVVALSQLNRESTRRSDPRPILSDLRESGAIEGHADVVTFVHRPGVLTAGLDTDLSVAELIVAKQRHGQLGSVPLKFIADCQTFEEPPPLPVEF